MKGMFGQIDVAGAPSTVRTPKATTVLSATEYALEFSRPLRAGDATIAFRNAGMQDHDYALVQLPDSADPTETARRLGRADPTLRGRSPVV